VRAKYGFLVAGLTVWMAMSAFCQNEATAHESDKSSKYLQQATEGVEALRGWYDESTGLYKTTGWWNSANAITVLADYSRALKTQQHVPTLAHTFTAAQTTSPNFINKFYDDEGWWALAWIDAYDLTREPRYLEMAETIFADMAGGWDTGTCGGGIWWSKDNKYKNAIANELFLSVAAHLANRTSGSQRSSYAKWSKREWKWFSKSGMINAQNLINDGLNSSNPRACKNNGQTTWSYNQGVILGGLAEFSQFASRRASLRKANQFADAAITHLADKDGVLHDSCEPKCGEDGPQFKGIFARNLARLYASTPNSSYRTFAMTNADSIWKKAQGSDYEFGLVWSGPFDVADAARQSSALDAIVAAAFMTQGQ